MKEHPKQRISAPNPAVAAPARALDAATPPLSGGHEFSRLSVLPVQDQAVQAQQAQQEQTQPEIESAGQGSEQVMREADGQATAEVPAVGAPPATPLDGKGGKPGASGATTFNLVPKTRAVSGKTLTEVGDAMMQGGGEAGSVKPALTPNPQYEYDDNDIVTKATVGIQETKTMPQWTELGSQCPPIQAEWNRFYAALDGHENGHVAIDRGFYENVHLKLVGKKREAAWTLLDKVVTDADQKNEEYDTSTGHGLTQGTKINGAVQCRPEKVGLLDSLWNDISNFALADNANASGDGNAPSLQAKLTVNTPGDAYEQEADATAERVMRVNAPAHQDGVAASLDATEMQLSRKDSDDASASDDVTPLVGDVIGSSGQPLDAQTRAFMEPRFGHDFSSVRVHSDARASQSAEAVQARAYTVGQNIAFRAGEYAPGTTQGKKLLAHELTHVVQQGAAGQVARRQDGSGAGEVGGEREENAGTGELAMNGPLAVTRAQAQVSRFAQGKTDIGKDEQGNSVYKGGTGHAGMTEEALQGMGLNVDQARQGRMGNWERDMSQALTPGTVDLLSAEGIMPMLNILAIKEFGRGLNIAEFGTYDPVEHIDNPTDLRGSEVFNQADKNAPPDSDFTHPTNPDVGDSKALAGTTGSKDKGYAEEDRRYKNTETQGKIMNPGDAAAFQVDESAVPRYMNTSKKWLTGTLRGAAMLGRNKEDGRGPRDFGSGIHTMQDFYAHSNFCEIGINMLIRQGGLQIATSEDAKGQPTLETLDKSKVVNTQIHANNPDGTVATGNLVNADAKGGPREVMTTGSFNLTDTAASILEEVADKVKEMNPFDKSKKGPSEVAMACLDYLEMDKSNPADFSQLGKTFSRALREATQIIGALSPTIAAAAEGAGTVGAGAVKGAATAGAGALDALNWANEKLGGDKGYFDQEKQAVKTAGDATAKDISDTTAGTANAIRAVNTQLDALAAQLEGESHLLRTAYEWAYKNSPLKLIKETAKKIPVVGEAIAAAIEKAETTIREAAEATLGAAWNHVVDKTVAGINRVIAKIRAQTNIKNKKQAGANPKFGGVSDLYDEQGNPKNGIAPQSYTPPSHTEIAKDHDDIENPAKDGHADGPNQPLDHDHKDGDHEHGDDEHGHNHISSYLAPLAAGLAKMASNGIGKEVAACWDDADKGQTPSKEKLDAIDKKIGEYFAHPADCAYWQDYFRAQLKTARIGSAVKEKLGSF